jgi:hypothetical protein
MSVTASEGESTVSELFPRDLLPNEEIDLDEELSSMLRTAVELTSLIGGEALVSEGAILGALCFERNATSDWFQSSLRSRPNAVEDLLAACRLTPENVASAVESSRATDPETVERYGWSPIAELWFSTAVAVKEEVCVGPRAELGVRHLLAAVLVLQDEASGLFPGAAQARSDLGRSFQSWAATSFQEEGHRWLTLVARPGEPAAVAQPSKAQLFAAALYPTYQLSRRAARVVAAATALVLRRRRMQRMLGARDFLFGMAEVGRGGDSAPRLLFEALHSYQSREAYDAEVSARYGTEGPLLPSSLPDARGLFQPPSSSPILRIAATAALQTSGRSTIQTRHLLFALLSYRNPSLPRGVPADLIRGYGVEPRNLARQLHESLEQDPEYEEKEDSEAWAKLVESVQMFGRQVPQIAPDIVEQAKDLLGRADDIDAVAALLASDLLRPPLSIGVFGEWGSGKSFFMQQLRAAIEGYAKSSRGRRDRPFCTEILQVEFNAWHYVESNLWASLVTKIFEDLHRYLSRDQVAKEEADKVNKLFEDLQTARQLQTEAANAAAQALAIRERANASLVEAKRERGKLSTVFAGLMASGPFDSVDKSDAPSKARDVALKLFGTEAVEDLTILEARVARTRRVGGYALEALRYVGRGLSVPKIVLLFACVILGSVALLFMYPELRNLGTAIGESCGLALTAVGWVVVRWKQATDQLEALAPLDGWLEKKLAVGRATREKDIADAKSNLAMAEAKVVEAERLQMQADQNLAAAEKAAEEPSAARRLRALVEERVRSDQYARHLGLMALISRDFRDLSTKMLAISNTSRGRDVTDPYVDRIVLYVDDLDRCPPPRVIEVLQAIHLLLAFPLFVVVVGVDVRWLVRSLGTEYAKLLVAPEGAPFGLTSRDATPHDYLEKIFQIPYWLAPMQRDGASDLVHALLAGDGAVARNRTTPAPAPGPGSPGSPSTGDAESPPTQPMLPGKVSDANVTGGDAGNG